MTGPNVTDGIDVLLVEPSDADARRTLAVIRQTQPDVSTLRVVDAAQATRVMFDQGLFTEAPQKPRLIIVDLAAAGQPAKEALLRLKAAELPRQVPVVIFSARRNSQDIVDAHLLGAHLNLQKPEDPIEYEAAVARIIRMWVTRSFLPS